MPWAAGSPWEEGLRLAESLRHLIHPGKLVKCDGKPLVRNQLADLHHSTQRSTANH